MGDLIQGVFHPGREAGVHKVRKVLFQKSRHRKSSEAWGEGVAEQGGVTAIHDRADDRGVGGGSPDPFLLQHLDQGSLAETGRWLRLVTERLNLFGFRSITDREGRQEHFLPFQSCIRVITSFHVGAEETWKIDALAASPEARLAGAEINRQHREPGFRHLTGNGALPDQLIDREITTLKPSVSRGAEAFAGGTNRLMGFLGIAGLGVELTGALAQVLLSVERFHAAARRTDRLIGEMHRVGAHVRDETALIKSLRAAHGFAG